MSTTLAPLRTPTFTWEWGRRTYVMGIVNVTPDSFSGDGLAGQLDAVVERARAMIAAGADVIDVGHTVDRPHQPARFVDRQDRRGLGAVLTHPGMHRLGVVVGPALEFMGTAAIARAGFFRLLEDVVIALAALGAGETAGDALHQRFLVFLVADLVDALDISALERT